MLDSTKQKKSSLDTESAREKLGRYLIVNYPDGVDIEAIFDELTADPDVLYVSIVESVPLALSAAPPPSGAGGTTNAVITENTVWGYNIMRVAQAESYAHGHAYIGVMDLGIDTQHPEFIDYIGNTWMGGNYHPNLGFSVSRDAHADNNLADANPYTATANLGGSVDAYNLVQLAGDVNCDANGDGTSGMAAVGHGSHVAGIIGANATNSLGVRGVCRSCPLSIAQYNYPACLSSPFSHYDISNWESGFGRTNASIYVSMGYQIDIGVQVINYSGGDPSFAANYCTANANDEKCLTLTYAEDREVMIVASAGNSGVVDLQFPASDQRVIGVSGLENVNGGQFWTGNVGFGSSFGTNQQNGPTFSAPARDVFSTLYPGKIYNIARECDEHTDGDDFNGYGYCTGTSMSAPFISGVAGLVRSVNPLMSKSVVSNIMQRSIAGAWWTHDNELGFGTPRADYAVTKALGRSSYSQVLNRVTPLFSMYGSVAEDIAQTTKPQVATAFSLNTLLGYQPHSTEALVNGFAFSESPLNPSIGAPRADIFLLTTHRTPPTGRAVTPLYCQNWYGPYGGNSNDADWTLVLESELSGSNTLKAAGYMMDGIAGYIYTLCSPEPSCIPPGAVIIYRAYNPQRHDRAVFTASKLGSMQSLGYTLELKKLGYAYPNQDSDSDGIIDGMEYILGTKKFSNDSDCDGILDGIEYPLTGMPVSDPNDDDCGGW